MLIETINKKLSEALPSLREDYHVQSLGVFGSYVRGEARSDSDLDILVEFYEPIGLLKFIDLENHLSDLIGIKVDLVTRKALKPRIGQRILQELIII